MPYYELTPWNQISEDVKQQIGNLKAYDENNKQINPSNYENSSFYLRNGQLPKDSDIDEWIRLGKPDDFVPPSLAGVDHPVQNNYTYSDAPLNQDFLTGKSFNTLWHDSYINALDANNDILLGDQRTQNMRSAETNNPNFMDNWKVFENAMEGFNYASSGFLNRLSPTQNLRLGWDFLKGEPILNGTNGSWWGNNGIVTNNFAKDHPYWSLFINGAGDGLGYGSFNTASKFISSPSGKFTGEFLKELPSLAKTTMQSYNSDNFTLNMLKSKPVTNLFNSKNLAQTPIGKRLAETIMRSYPGGDPRSIYSLLFSENLKNLKNTVKYVLTGKNNIGTKISARKNGYYSGGAKATNGQDIVDTYIYNQELSPELGNRITLSEILPEHQEYLSKNYPGRSVNAFETKDINIKNGYYEPLTQEEINEVIKNGKNIGITSRNENMPLHFNTQGGRPDVGGYIMKYLEKPDGTIHTITEDVWKYNKNNFNNRYGLEAFNGPLQLIDNAGSPIIFRSAIKTTSKTPEHFLEELRKAINGEYSYSKFSDQYH